jgi:hypothetical protein
MKVVTDFDLKVYRDPAKILMMTEDTVKSELLGKLKENLKVESYHDENLHGTVIRTEMTVMKR